MVIKVYTVGDNCDACKATIAWLKKRGIDYEVVNLEQYE